MARRLLLAPALVWLLAGGCEKHATKGVVLDTSIEKLIPADTAILAGARLKQIQSSPLYQKLAADRKIPELESFAKRTGLDPRKDLEELVIASNGKETLLIGRGRIEDRAKLEALLEKEGAQRIAYGKETLIGNDMGAVAFLSNSIAIAGSTAAVKQAIDRANANTSAKAAVLKKAAELPSDKHVWVVTVGGFSPMPLPEQGNLANLNRIFQALEATSMTLDLHSGLSLAVQGVCNDDISAKQLHNTLRGLIGFGRLSTSGDHPEILRFFDSIKVEQNNKQVKLNADVPQDLVDEFIKLTDRTRPRNRL